MIAAYCLLSLALTELSTTHLPMVVLLAPSFLKLASLPPSLAVAPRMESVESAAAADASIDGGRCGFCWSSTFVGMGVGVGAESWLAP